MPTTRTPLRTGTALLGIALAGVVIAGPAADAATTRTVTMTSSNMFMPVKLTITRGTVVVWKNSSFSSHTVTANSGAWNSGVVKPGTSYSRTFRKAGTVRYHCSIHQDMVGVITVR